MTILKSELISVVNKTLKRGYDPSGTELDSEIISSLKNLSQRGNFLTEESTRKTIANRPYYSMPDHYKDRLLIMLDDYYPLGWETFKNYQEERSAIPNETGYPQVFCKMNKFYYLRPTPDTADYTIRQFFACYHPETFVIDEETVKACDHILFNDIYRKALELRLLWEVASGLGRSKTASDYMTYYVRDEIPSLLANLDEDPVFTEYPDE